MKEIDWNKWSSIAEIVSSIAILVTLVYLAIQTQQNTDAINAQSRQSLFDGGQEELPVWIQYPELSTLIIDSTKEITLEQKVQLDGLLVLALGRREFAWRQYQTGVLDEDSWIADRRIIALLLGSERTREWWHSVGKLNYGGEFPEVVESIFEGQPLDPYWQGLQNW